MRQILATGRPTTCHEAKVCLRRAEEAMDAHACNPEVQDLGMQIIAKHARERKWRASTRTKLATQISTAMSNHASSERVQRSARLALECLAQEAATEADAHVTVALVEGALE